MRKFETPAPTSAVLDVPAGRVQFIAADRADTVVEVLPADASKGRDTKPAATEFRAVGRLGDVTFAGAYGRVKVDEAASVRISAVAGDVWAGRLSGRAKISTSKGDIHVAEAVRGQVTLHTDMGDIEVCAAPGVSAALDAGTSRGRIRNALKNDGTAELDICATTSYGDITARSL